MIGHNGSGCGFNSAESGFVFACGFNDPMVCKFLLAHV